MRILLLPLPMVAAVAFLVFTGCLAEAAGKKHPAQTSYDGPPMYFAIVRSNASGCEPNCPEWISAEGTITKQTPELFRKILKRAGKTRLPILITSQGGDVDAAIAMGEIIRTRKLNVGVGWTLFASCWPNDKVCLFHGPQGGIHYGTPVTWRAYCLSACSFILAGGQKRLAGGATLGISGLSSTVSSQRVFYEERYRMVNGKKKIVSRKIIKREPVKTYTTSKLDKPTRKKLGSYVTRMGLTKGFLALFTEVPSGSVAFPTSREALSMGLVTAFDSARSLVDSQLCLTAPAAENCIKLAASTKQQMPQ